MSLTGNAQITALADQFAPIGPNGASYVGSNEWDFSGVDTQYSTHGIHTYVAAMIPTLARRLIEEYAPKDGIVLDPFCGGGAVMVEAISSGRRAVGRDVNNLAVLVSKAKTKRIRSEAIQKESRKVLRAASEFRGPAATFPASASVEYWFKDYMLLPLTGLKTSIGAIENRTLRTLFQTLFSGTVRSVSLTLRNEVRLRRMPPEQEERFNPDIFETFEKYVALALERVPELPSRSSTDIRRADTRKLRLKSKSVDTTICSPPYGDERNGVNYTQFSKNMLYWLGYSHQDIQSTKDQSLGWGKTERLVPPSRTLIDSLSGLSENPRAVWEATAFYGDYYDTLRQIVRVTRDRVVIVIGNRVLNQRVLDNAQITIEMMDALGMSLEAHHNRQLPSKRLPKMREAGAAIDREAILVFQP